MRPSRGGRGNTRLQKGEKRAGWRSEDSPDEEIPASSSDCYRLSRSAMRPIQEGYIRTTVVPFSL